MRFKWIIGVLLANACLLVGHGQYRILPGKTIPGDFEDCDPKTPARICLGSNGEEHCYLPPSDKLPPPSEVAYIFGLEPKAKAVGRLNGQDLTLFTATYSGCGSGTLTHFSLLTVREGKFVNLLPNVELTNQSEYKIWRLPLVSSLPVLATADFIWGMKAGETHFAHHRYTINLYVFDAKSGKYLRRIEYETTKKYPGLDDADEIKVLDAEKPAILAKLRQR